MGQDGLYGNNLGGIMKYYDITIKFTINKDEYNKFDKNIDRALDLILPYGANVNIHENEYEEEE